MIAKRLFRLRDRRYAAIGFHVCPGDGTVWSRYASVTTAVGRRIGVAGLGRIAMADFPVENAGPPSSPAAAGAATTQNVLL